MQHEQSSDRPVIASEVSADGQEPPAGAWVAADVVELVRDAIATMRQSVTETLEAARDVYPRRPTVAVEVSLHEATLAALEQLEKQLEEVPQPDRPGAGVHGPARLLGEITYVALVEAAERCVEECAQYWEGPGTINALCANARRISTLTDVLVACDAQRHQPQPSADRKPSAD